MRESNWETSQHSHTILLLLLPALCLSPTVLSAADSASLCSPFPAVSAPADLLAVSLESESDAGVDISDVAKQLVFSPLKSDENENQNSNEQAAPAAEEVKPVEAAVAPIEAAAVEPIAVSSPLRLACSTPLPADDEDAAAAPSSSVDDDDSTVATAFPTFSSALDSDDLHYVSAEMKTQEMLLLEATQPEAAAAIKTKGIKSVAGTAKSSVSSTPRSRSQSRSNASSAQSTPRSSSVQRSSSSASRLTAPTFSSSKRRAESATRTPQSFARDVSSAMAGLALLTGAAGERKKPTVVAGEAKKLTVASSPKLKTSGNK